MDDFQRPWIRAVVLEHACKHRMNSVIKLLGVDRGNLSSLFEHFNTCEPTSSEGIKIDPLILLACTLEEFRDNLTSVENFTQYWKEATYSFTIDLLESTFKQNNYTSLKKFLTFVSGLKLLDLLNMVVESSQTRVVVQKLYSYFPNWTEDYETSFEKNFNLSNKEVFEKVKQSNTQCRRLILKLAADKTYKMKYIEKQYQADLNRLTKEFDSCLSEIILSLECRTGPTVLEQLSSGALSPNSDDWPVRILMDYMKPDITEEALLRYLEDFEVNFQTDSPPCLHHCLTPFESLSQVEGQPENQDIRKEDSPQIDESLARRKSEMYNFLHRINKSPYRKCENQEESEVDEESYDEDYGPTGCWDLDFDSPASD